MTIFVNAIMYYKVDDDDNDDNAIMYYKVDDAAHCLTNVDDASASAQLLTATTLRNCLGTRNLGEILSEKESIATEMKEVLDVATKPWGVKVERVEVNEMFHYSL